MSAVATTATATAASTRAPRKKSKPFSMHSVAVGTLAAALIAILIRALIHGAGYYILSLEERPLHPLHRDLRPGSPTGIAFGLFSTLLFAVIYVYPLRKKWTWLRKVGVTSHWLNFHIVLGLAAPFLVLIHSAFKLRGLAGMAYWIMLSVVLSGLVGRYLYAQIPRSRKDAELSLAELQRMSAELSAELHEQAVVPEAVWRPLVTPVDRNRALAMPLGSALAHMIVLDMERPLRMAALRRNGLKGWERITTLEGLLAFSHPELERVVTLARSQSWLTAKICFLDRAGQVFRLWHTVHRPFSLAFVALVVIHIGMAVWMGFLSSNWQVWF